MANRVFRWDQPTIRIGLWVTLAVSLAICLVPFAHWPRWRPLVLGLAALAAATWMVTGVVTSGRGSEAGARALVTNLPRPLNWVDVRTGGAGVTYLGQQIGDDPGLWLTEFWNRSIKHVWTLDGSAPGPGPTLTPDLAAPDGTLRVDPGLDYVLADNGVEPVGKVIQNEGSLSLIRVGHPWKLRETYYGRSSDGWIGNDGTFAYFGPAVPGTLNVDVSRANFCPTNAPPTAVTVRIGPVALNEQRAATVAHATVVRHFLLHSCTHVPIQLHITPPVAVTVHVANLVRLSDYGISDSSCRRRPDRRLVHAERHALALRNYPSAVVGTEVLIERDETPVMFKRVADESNAISRGMAEVEKAVGLHGRKYYGAFDNDGEYRVCVQLREGDDPQAFGLEVGTLPGGRYARLRLTGEPPGSTT